MASVVRLCRSRASGWPARRRRLGRRADEGHASRVEYLLFLVTKRPYTIALEPPRPGPRPPMLYAQSQRLMSLHCLSPRTLPILQRGDVVQAALLTELCNELSFTRVGLRRLSPPGRNRPPSIKAFPMTSIWASTLGCYSVLTSMIITFQATVASADQGGPQRSRRVHQHWHREGTLSVTRLV